MPSDESYIATRGHCFKVVIGVSGQSLGCPNLVTVHGSFWDAEGWPRPVDACAQHADELDAQVSIEDMNRLLEQSFGPRPPRAPRPKWN
jgi:hypothetical protein